jgi:hypothetical protein
MMFKFLKYYLLLLIIFAIDKLVLIPVVKLNFTNAAAANPYEETLEDLDPPVQENRERTVWVFGSSRSMPFLRFPVDSQTKVDPYLTGPEKEVVLRTSFLAFTYSAANPYLYLTRLHQLLDRGLKADLIAIELSPSALNRNRSINNVIIMEGIPLVTAWKHPESYPYELRKDILLSRLFATYRYKTDFVALLTWRPRKEALAFEKLGGAEAFQMATGGMRNRVDRVYREEEWNDLPLSGGDPALRAQRFELFTRFHEELYFSGWQLDPALIDAIVAMTRIGHEQGIPVVVFKPALYPTMNALKSKYGYETEILPELLARMQPYEGIYVDMNEPGRMKCQFYTDASHLSPRCFTELSARLLEAGRLMDL